MNYMHIIINFLDSSLSEFQYLYTIPDYHSFLWPLYQMVIRDAMGNIVFLH